MSTVLHLRSECKPYEKRSALTPTTTKALIAAGYKIHVEKNPSDAIYRRIFTDEDFAAAGASLVETGSWVNADPSHIIVGLKELPEDGKEPWSHEFIHFQHCYKQQSGWQQALRRFKAGGGTLYDLEFLTDPNTKRRVAAFGYSAGYAGAALALLAWAHQISSRASFPSVSSYSTKTALNTAVKAAVSSTTHPNSPPPRILIMGALGRCGTGALDMCASAGIPRSAIQAWDIAETSLRVSDEPFSEITDSDIFINCILLSTKVAPFVTRASLNSPNRKLRVVCDISCDPTSPFNPVPIYDSISTFFAPTIPVEVESDPPLSVIAIDHLPSLIPREASEAFSADLLPSLKNLRHRETDPVWAGGRRVFDQKVAELPS